ncbi:MAG: homoserine O-acetyltransferase [Pseudomonadales bacterium]|nr:homoserine O-acetyltransferase [Pseudomonadales bacterium]
MPSSIPADSVGVVVPQQMDFAEPVTLSSGRTLTGVRIVYETYGTLNAARSNAVLICHALSGHHHAAGYHSLEDEKPGWWDYYIGPGKPIDTNRFFVVSLNNIGGCHGSTGPASINPETGKPWGPDFPRLRVRDWVKTQAMLMTALGIDVWAAVIGGSLGGMQAMRWCVDYPDRVRHCVVIASAIKLSAQNIAFNEIARRAITSDPDFHDGRYLEHGTAPRSGLAIARMVGHVTYLSSDAMSQKFGRDLRSGTFATGEEADIEFQVGSYLRYQGESFSDRFDANTYLLMTQALDYFDLSRDYNYDPAQSLRATNSRFLVISFYTDWRFPPERSREIANALIRANKSVSYVEVDSEYGHDAFLIPIERYQQVFAAYMQSIEV